MSVKELKLIRRELKELRRLYIQLVDKLVPTEEPAKEERKAIEEKDKTVGEKELMDVLS